MGSSTPLYRLRVLCFDLQRIARMIPMKGRLQPYFFASMLLVLALVVTACAAPAGPAASGGAMADDGEEMAGRPLPDDAAEEQVIRYVTRNFSRMNPASEGGFGRPFVSHIWMTLFLRDYEHHPQPWLATGYDVSDDGLTYTIHIHPAPSGRMGQR